MIDVHCHLNFPVFDKDIDDVINRAKEKGVSKIINVGTSIKESKKVISLSEKYEDLYSIVGVHPHDADQLESNWLSELETIAKSNKVLGIGEIGLDYFQHEIERQVDKNVQKEIFTKQIELAIKLKLPLQIHSRQASKDIIEILKSYKNEFLNPPGMFHCFAGSIDYLKDALDLGFYIGFDGNSTYKGMAPGETTLLTDLIKYAPIDRILTETDAPFLTPHPHRGSRNEPSYVIIVGNFIAEIKNTSFEDLELITTENTRKVFNI